MSAAYAWYLRTSVAYDDSLWLFGRWSLAEVYILYFRTDEHEKYKKPIKFIIELMYNYLSQSFSPGSHQGYSGLNLHPSSLFSSPPGCNQVYSVLPRL